MSKHLFTSRNLFLFASFLTVALLLGGCPYGVLLDSGTETAPSATTSDSDGGSSDSTTTGTDGEGDDTATTDTEGGETETDVDGGTPEGRGTLVVETLPDAVNTYFDIYTVPDGTAWSTYEAANTPVRLPAGVYDLTQYFNAMFLYGDDVTITAGETTTVTLGAIELVTVDGATDTHFDIYDATGQDKYSSYNAANTRITAPPGTFVLKEYFNASFDFARDVVVTAGEVTRVEMGGIRLVIVDGAVNGHYDIYSEDGNTAYATYKAPNDIITAPPGTFTLKQYFNPDFTYASDLVVEAGEVTTVEMGAIRYNGTLAYDIYTGGQLVSSFNEAGLIVTAPPGTYLLTEYFNDENVLADNVVVVAGQITDVP